MRKCANLCAKCVKVVASCRYPSHCWKMRSLFWNSSFHFWNSVPTNGSFRSKKEASKNGKNTTVSPTDMPAGKAGNRRATALTTGRRPWFAVIGHRDSANHSREMCCRWRRGMERGTVRYGASRGRAGTDDRRPCSRSVAVSRP